MIRKKKNFLYFYKHEIINMKKKRLTPVLVFLVQSTVKVCAISSYL